jgi:hypothetical protein
VRLIRVDGCDLHVKGIDLPPPREGGWIDAVPHDAPSFRRYEPESRSAGSPLSATRKKR